MKRNLILIPSVIFFLLALTVFKNEALIYLSAILMAIIIIIALRYLGPRGMKITRWAKANSRKAQVLITVLQVIILSIGLLVGYDLKELGYKFSDPTALVFDTLMVFGFLSVHFFPRKAIVALPVDLNKDRITYAGIMIAVYSITVIIGNRVEDKYPNSMLSDVLRSVDHKIFLQSSTPNDNQYSPIAANSPIVKNEAPVFSTFASLVENEKGTNKSSLSEKEAKAKLKAERKAERQQKRMMRRIERLRGEVATGASAGTVLLIILLVLTTCAGACLIVGGFSGGGAGAVALGAVVMAGSIWGIVKLSKKKKKPK
jgi:predicted anti-sigma-YlaC factor YlaD